MKKKDFKALVGHLNHLARPLRPGELIAQGIEDGVIDSGGRSSSQYLESEWADMCRRIEAHVQDSERLGQRPRIRYLPDIDRIIPGSFVSKTEAEEPRHLKEAVKIGLGSHMVHKIYTELDDYEFQEFCANFLELLGCTDCKVQPRGPDGGIDFSGTLPTPLSAVAVIGQAKHHAEGETVSDGEVKKLYATVKRETGSRSESVLYLGVFITTSAFSRQATQFAKSVHPLVYLVDGQQLADALIERDVGIDYSDPPNIALDSRNPRDWFS